MPTTCDLCAGRGPAIVRIRRPPPRRGILASGSLVNARRQPRAEAAEGGGGRGRRRPRAEAAEDGIDAGAASWTTGAEEDDCMLTVGVADEPVDH
jgi:hypothetical protein